MTFQMKKTDESGVKRNDEVSPVGLKSRPSDPSHEPHAYGTPKPSRKGTLPALALLLILTGCTPIPAVNLKKPVAEIPAEYRK